MFHSPQYIRNINRGTKISPNTHNNHSNINPTITLEWMASSKQDTPSNIWDTVSNTWDPSSHTWHLLSNTRAMLNNTWRLISNTWEMLSNQQETVNKLRSHSLPQGKGLQLLADTVEDARYASFINIQYPILLHMNIP
jgi:hypothetical protein